jgi:hypothetical protein
MSPLYIYFDEFGHFSPDQSKQGTYSHFVYSALIFSNDDDKNLFEARAKEIISKDFNGNFFKSKNLQQSTRMRVLGKLMDLPWRLSVFIVDQKKLEGPLIEYKQSFLKYFQRIFLKGLTEGVNDFHIEFDKLGSSEFQTSLQIYVDKYVVKRDLFNQTRSYQMFDEKRDRNAMLCFADFFANSLGQYFCKSHYKDKSSEFVNQVIGRVQTTYFPYREIYDNRITKAKFDSDSIISDIALQIANQKLEELYLKEEKHITQALLEFLIINFKLNPTKLLSLPELTEHLQFYFPGINDDRTRTMISELRGVGVLIISSKGRAGYKLPNSVADFDVFFKRYLDSVVPMLKRIEQSQNIVFNRSNSKVDLLNTVSNQSLLKDFLAVINKS